MVKSPTYKKRIVVLDAHAIIHRAYHALPTFFSSKGEPTGALYGVCSMLIKIATELRPDYVIACYDLPKPTFRHIAYKDYKAGRQKADDSLVSQLGSSRAVFEAFSVPIYEAAGFEADDVIGTVIEQLREEKDIQIIIASGDMDTMQLIEGNRVQVYTLKKGIHDTILYDEDAIVSRFGFHPTSIPDYKGLAGDPSDNIIGIKGIGQKTATTLIGACGTIEELYTRLETKKETAETLALSPRMLRLLQEGKEEATFSKTLATIRRDAPIVFSLPEKSWHMTVDMKRIEEMLTLFEFRSLKTRVHTLFAESTKNKEEEEGSPVDPEAFEEAALCAWLLDANRTTPGLEAILEVAQKETFVEAHKALVERVLAEEPFRSLFLHIEKPLSLVLKKMGERGILLDVPYLETLRRLYENWVAGLEKDIYREAGREFNISSPKQIGEILFNELHLEIKGVKKTSTGAYSTNIETLHKLEHAHPIIPRIIEHREAEKMLSTYILTLPKLLGSDGRIHTQFLQTGASTGRLSSKDPNMQNIPTTEVEGKNVRKAFISAEGKSFVSFDYSQIELRVAAILSEDKTLTAIFTQGEDVHMAVAREVYKVTNSDVTKEMRRHAKAINFGILYGMGVSALKESLGTERKEAQAFYDAYKESFRGLMSYLERVKKDAASTGYTETLFGRRRPMPLLRSPLPFVRAQGERMAINAPIQGTAADIMRLATIDVYNALQKENLLGNAAMLLQIHDELVLEVDDEMVARVIDIVREVMEQVLILHKDIFWIQPPTLVDLVVGVRTGKTLGALTEL